MAWSWSTVMKRTLQPTGAWANRQRSASITVAIFG